MILLCLPDGRDEEVINHLASFDRSDLVARSCADLAEVTAGVDAGLATTVLVSGDLDGLDLSLVNRWQARGVRVGIVPGRMPPRRIRALGAEAVADIPAFLMERAEEVGQAPSHHGKQIVVWGPGGSTGRSALVRDLASVADDVLVVDADTQRPALAQLYGVEETSAIVAVARHIERGQDPRDMLDSALVDIPAACRAAQAQRAMFLAGLNTGERWRELPRVVVDRMWEPLAEQAGHIIIDLSGGMDGRAQREDRHAVTRSALAAADVVLHVGRGSPVGLRRFIEHVDSVGEQIPKQHGVILAAAKALGVDGKAKAKALVADSPIPCTIINSDQDRLDECELTAKAMPRAYPRSAYSAGIRRLWQQLISD
ncbi:hypothetical protein [Trueperella bialowiezensis]|uniref:Flp pilus assembly protein, ATPase CpaE n=1 Tax=Trueperella bialowiezensis TaxID=312285 RepID=A0A3S4VBB8_9ACTO|nr:hypothetical protein [Trueperella bialowiezensis]VEI13719.1 Uncharacterised protein [Trueperella bialowiezensis]